MSRWFKLEGPHVSLNAPNVKRLVMTHAPVIPAGMGVADMVAEVQREGVRHLVINCHGYAAGPPRLEIGRTIDATTLAPFDALAALPKLRVIWLSACNLAGSADGLAMCKAIAERALSYVVSQTLAVPDRIGGPGQIEDYDYAMPVYVDPWGELATRQAFLDAGGALGFQRL